MEPGVNGLRGLSVTKAVTEAREKDIDSVTIHFLCTEELIALEIDMNLRTVIQRVVLVSEIEFMVSPTQDVFLKKFGR